MTALEEASTTSLHSATSPAGVLLIHGLNGSPSDMAEIATILRARKLAVKNMLLPGHGSHVRAMLSLGWPDWAEAVRAEYRELRKSCARVFVIGHSLGGALALDLAAHEDVAGLVSMCSPLYLRAWMSPAIRAAKHLLPLVPTLREDVHDPKARQQYARDVYRWTPLLPVESLLNYLPTLRAELPQISAPALIMVAARDHVVPPRDGRAIYHHIGSREKYFVTFHSSYHVLMKDYDRAEVFAKTEAFILRYACNLHVSPF
jgi:carboxylesterase